MWAFITKPSVRSWAYRIGFIITTYLGVKGTLDNNDVMYINLLIGAILLVADANVPRAAAYQAQPPPVVVNPSAKRTLPFDPNEPENRL